ncbi:MAG: cysteine protease StiP family protein [Fusobacteriaceae bacterium]|jgi:hypothetical protein|nr:cysteine protease StiP family protein [Fusobacteriaceae bacterium]
MRSSYTEDDVILLLKDITGLIIPKKTDEREKLIQSGIHYSEMLPLEDKLGEQYIQTYKLALKNYAKSTANAVSVVSEKIYEKNKKNKKNIVLVSLARAGTPIGILIKRYLEKKYRSCYIKHYSISIIRGRGIDKNAMSYILDRHSASDIQFVDGWTGKGAILKELEKNIAKYPNISPKLAVISDPANITDMCGTHEDILIPSSCLNSTVSGLISRTFLRDDIIKNYDFHGAMYYEEFENEDVSYEFIEEIEKNFDFNAKNNVIENNKNKENIDGIINENINGVLEVEELAKFYSIKDINFIKPGIGETTRVLLRRTPWKIIINKQYENSGFLIHLFNLAMEKKVPIEYYPLKNYKACGIIKNISDI